MPDRTSLSPAWIAALVLVLGGAGFLFVSTYGGGGEEETIAPPRNLEIREDTYALLVGCTEYPVLKRTLYKDRPLRYDARVRLIGPGNDVDLMHVTLRDYLGVPEANITVLKEREGGQDATRPTRENILAWLDARAAEGRAGDRVIFHFSGHGSQVPSDADDDEERDLYDEVLLAADVTRFARTRDGYPGGITDDELRERVARIRATGAEVWLCIDCCHAGSMARGEEDGPTRVRRIAPRELGVPEPARSRGSARPRGARQTLAAESGVVAFYSVPSYEEAPEKPLPPTVDPSERRYHGVFTYLLARTLQRYGGAITFKELHAHLLAAYETLPYDRVAPYAEGDLDLRVARDGRDRRHKLQVRRSGDTLTLNAGSVRGFAKGTQLEVRTYATSDEPERVLGAVEIVDAGYVASTLAPLDEKAWARAGELPALMQARVTRASTEGFRLYLTVLDDAGEPVAPDAYPEELKAFLRDPKDEARVPRVGPDEADFALRVGAERMRLERLEPGNDTRFLTIERGNLARRLRAVFRAQNIRRLANGDSVAPLPEGLRVRILRNGEPLERGGALRPGDELQVGVTNETERDYAVTVALVDANHGISIIWPRSGDDGSFTHRDHGEARTDLLDVTDDHFGTECLLVLAVPRRQRAKHGEEAKRDAGTMTPYHFLDLEQEALDGTRGPGDRAPPSAKPLLRVVFGEPEARSRGLAPDPDHLAIGLRTWRTDWGPLRVPPSLEGQDLPTALRGMHAEAGTAASPVAGRWFVGAKGAVLAGKESKQDEEGTVVEIGRADAFATWSDDVLQVYVDTDGDAALATTDVAALAERAKAGTLDVELAFRIEPGRRLAWYSPVELGRPLARLLVDEDADPQADRRFEWRDGRWEEEASEAAWLCTAEMGWTDWRDDDVWLRRVRTIRALASFTRR